MPRTETRVEVVPATREHGVAVAANMAAADVAEVWAQAAATPLQAVEISLAGSHLAWAGVIDGETACLFGLAAHAPAAGEACPWLLATPLIYRHRTAFLRRSKRFIRRFLTLHSRLSGHVDQRHTLSVAWLRWLGFTLAPPSPHGWLGLPFHRFELAREDTPMCVAQATQAIQNIAPTAASVATGNPLPALLSGAVQIAGMQQQQNIAAQRAAYDIAVARNNQILAEQSAQDAIDKGLLAQQEQRQKTAALIGSQRALLAAHGIDVNSGTAMDLQNGTAAQGETDAQGIFNTAIQQSQGYLAQASKYQGQADLQQSEMDQSANLTLSKQAGLFSSKAANFYFK